MSLATIPNIDWHPVSQKPDGMRVKNCLDQGKTVLVLLYIDTTGIIISGEYDPSSGNFCPHGDGSAGRLGNVIYWAWLDENDWPHDPAIDEDKNVE